MTSDESPANFVECDEFQLLSQNFYCASNELRTPDSLWEDKVFDDGITCKSVR